MKQIKQVEEEQDSLRKKKTLWEEYKENWVYLQREEQSLLEEVAYLSQGTVSANQAERQLIYFEEENQEVQRYFNQIDEGFDEKKKGLMDKEEELMNTYEEAKKREAANDEI